MENKRKQIKETTRILEKDNTKTKTSTVTTNQWKALCNDINLDCHRKLNGPKKSFMTHLNFQSISLPRCYCLCFLIRMFYIAMNCVLFNEPKVEEKK